MKSDSAIILFTRYPEPGFTKTRLIPVLNSDGAAKFHKNMINKIIKTITDFTENYETKLLISYSNGNLTQMQSWLDTAQYFIKQKGKNLGQRLDNTFQEAFSRGFNKVLITGSDVPEISQQQLQNAFLQLDKYDIVLGPSLDGGYYLIGSTYKAYKNIIFKDINWGRSSVLRDTIGQINAADQNYYLLKKLHDIDTPKDLEQLKNRKYNLYKKLSREI